MSEAQFIGTKFEAKKHAFRQTQDGVSVTFVMHPNDVDPDFAVAPLGTRYHVAVVQLGDDEQPIQKPRKETYAEKTPGEKAVVRAALLCRNTQFQDWMTQKMSGAKRFDEATCRTAMLVLFQIKSRSELATNEGALNAFLQREAQFKADTGQAAEER